MVRKLYEDAKNGIDTRQNLSILRREIRDDAKMNELFELVEDDLDTMRGFLFSDDPKTRKNAALLIGELDMSDFTDDLIEGYKREGQLFVRPAYLEAMKNYYIEEHLPYLRERVTELTRIEITDDNRKHNAEELRALTELIVAYDGVQKHVFTGFRFISGPVECILLTNKLHRDVTEGRLEGKDIELIPFKGGVRLRTGKLSIIKDIRTYSDIFFVIPDFKPCAFEPEAAAGELAGSGLIRLLDMLHTGNENPDKNRAFYFRTEIKSGLDIEKKGRFAKRFCAGLERLTARRLINSTSDYEIEIRLIEGSDGKLNALLKLYTIADSRFDYFKKHTASSIKPVNAALIVRLAMEYMKKDAQVLDPFCGAGTMLIERQKVVRANTSYGIDISKEALEAAKTNTEAAGQIIHYVNRDFFTFEHSYLFDEIFTDMPFSTGGKENENIANLYEKFFHRASKVIKKSGRIIMFSRNPDYALANAEKTGYKLVERYVITKTEKGYTESAVFVFDR